MTRHGVTRSAVVCLLQVAAFLFLFGMAFSSLKPKQAESGQAEQASYKVYAFTAKWCKACQAEKPQLLRLRERLRERGVEVIEIDYDTNPGLVRQYHVRKLPTYVVLKDGVEVRRTGSILLLIKILALVLKLFLL